MSAVGAVIILVGGVFGALAGLGQVRFADLFTRLHVATKPATLGLVLVAIGAAVRFGSVAAGALLGLSIVLQFLTAPVAAHLVGRAAHRRGDWANEEAVLDDLASIDEG